MSLEQQASFAREYEKWYRENITDKLHEYYYSHKAKTTNFGIVHIDHSQDGDSTIRNQTIRGKKDWQDKDSPDIDGDTMFPEASVGKIRIAGLAYIFDQEGILDIDTKATDFFAKPEVHKYLEETYPGIMKKIFTHLSGGGSEQSTFIDFTTHNSGVGDLRMHEISTKGHGIVYKYNLTEVLEESKSPARGPHNDKTNLFDDVEGKYGTFQYSNIGYMILGTALEAAYFLKYGKEKDFKKKDYTQLLKDFMLIPTEGKARNSGFRLEQTKYPNELTEADNIAKLHWYDPKTQKFVDSSRFNGHMAAVGPLSSTNDREIFFTEFFKGFPGTKEFGKNSNVFFNDKTIEKMQEIWKNPGKRIALGDGNTEKKSFLPPNMTHRADSNSTLYAGPGFMVEVSNIDGKELAYYKSGVQYGVRSHIEFSTGTGKTNIVTRLQENISGKIAKDAGVETKDIMEKFSDKAGNFDRLKVFQMAQMENGLKSIKEHMAQPLPDSEIEKVVASSASDLQPQRKV